MRIPIAGPAAAVGGGALAAAVYVAAYEHWRWRCLGWGATPTDVHLPGDDLLPEPDMLSTRAVTIAAPVSDVWPWLAQMGPGRGGAYTYDWIENLFGLGMHSTDEILPQFQNVAVGDHIRLGRSGPVLRLVLVEPHRTLVWRSDDGTWVWAFQLEAEGTRTRLISRNRISVPGASWARRMLDRYLMEPGSLVMERKMLNGIKDRAERLTRGAHAPTSTRHPEPSAAGASG
ncbi:hypothetical protein SAMN04515671_1744 [Nakamurella panacisegetis]|uniref:Polyketide cyclase / dehydrase and lipid transport n=1 Tax=Nakamurella panacisegetis TaxID=1090615 RepID=A0A1H0LP19_9ACTN|nr:hypothetical protein [Nakamurella panacisegetis]SDO69999.1 hypothetical protein SAMN04515671_1744 [Nakamurella panacisegetis]